MSKNFHYKMKDLTASVLKGETGFIDHQHFTKQGDPGSAEMLEAHLQKGFVAALAKGDIALPDLWEILEKVAFPLSPRPNVSSIELARLTLGVSVNWMTQKPTVSRNSREYPNLTRLIFGKLLRWARQVFAGEGFGGLKIDTASGGA